MYLKTLYLDGRIFTSNAEMPFAEAMAVSLGGIDFVGTNAEVLESVGVDGLYDPKLSDFEVVNLKGRIVIPGFVDADIRPSVDIVPTAEEFSKDLASKGIVAIAAEGTYEENGNPVDAYDMYFEATKRGLLQQVALYYPGDFAVYGDRILSDKQKLIRSRKVHVAGFELPVGGETSDDMLNAALKTCKDNSCQLSIKVSDEDSSETLIEGAKEEGNWLEDLGLASVRIHRGLADFNPFVDIKNSFLKMIERGVSQEDEVTKTEDGAPFFDLGTAVTGYTKYAAELAGFLGLGEIKAGNRASFIIVDKDLASIPVDELDTVHPEVTIIDGVIAYKAEGSNFALRGRSADQDRGKPGEIKLELK